MAGTYIEGRISPPVSNASVSIKRINSVSLADRIPTIVSTNERGIFRHGPVLPDQYEVNVTAPGWKFYKTSPTRYDFQA